MADSIKRVELAGGRTRYRLVIDVGHKPDGRRDQRTFTFDTLREARAERSRMIFERSRGTLVKPNKATVAELCAAWLASKRNLKPGPRRTYADALRRATDRIGHVRAAELTKRHVDELADFLLSSGRRVGTRKSSRLSPRSVQITLDKLDAVLEAAVRDGILSRNVAAHVERPRAAKAEMKTWTPEQATAFVSSVDSDRLSVAWQLSLYGLRRGEVLGLRWADIDIAQRTLTIRWTRTTVGSEIVEAEPKTPRSARSLPLDDALVAALDVLLLRQHDESDAAEEAYQPCPLCGGAHVVANELGQPYNPQWYSDRFAALVKVAAVPPIRLHDARHSCGSIMHARGVPIADISAWLGHASADFTMRTYVHSQTGALTAAGESLRAAYTSAPPAPAETGL